MRVSVNVLKGNANAHGLSNHMAKGIEATGGTAVMRTDDDWNMDGFDAAVFWGYVTSCQRLVQECQAKGIPWVYLDLAYWRREQGYFKVSINDRHMPYLMNMKENPDRFKALHIPIRPWRTDGTQVVLAGMSGKASWSWGMGDEEFETAAMAHLRATTTRPILYRPKPNFGKAAPKDGAGFDRTSSIESILRTAWCVVQHHSNVGVDALLEGVPVFTRHGAAKHLAQPIGPDYVFDVEHPIYPDGREQWAANLAYCQWTTAEMSSGACWKYVKGLIDDGTASSHLHRPAA